MNEENELQEIALSYLEKMQKEIDVFSVIAAHVSNKLSGKELYALIGAASVLESLAHKCRLAIEEADIK